jgi:beta-lactamase regulating signal transducer with metallopeptidase domain
LRVGLSNAVVACALAVVAALVGRFGRRPALSHALWLLVLVKLVTPALVDVPVPWPQEKVPVSVAEPAPEPQPEVVVLAEEPSVSLPVELEPADAIVEAPPQPVAEPPTQPVVTSSVAAWLDWRVPIIVLWIGGALAWLLLAARRAWGFARCLRFASPAGARLRTEVVYLARRLELPEPPEVLLLPGRISPMVWGLGRAPRLLLPAELLARLDDGSRQTLLAHELAHLRRRDQRVRLFELLVTALFWWHPVVWLARRELREAEEQCCDAWVLWALPRQAKTYALALVETVEFLSEARPALPPAASGVGHVNDLRRRVTMIMQGTTPRTLSWSGLLALFGAGAFLLPVMPTWAQQPPPAADQIRLRFAAEEEDDKRDTNRKEIDKLSERMLIEQIAAKKREIAELEAKLKAIQSGKPAAEKPGTGDIRLWRMIDGKAVEVKPGEQPKIILELLQDPKAKPDQPKALSAEDELRKRKYLEDFYRAMKEQDRPLIIEVIVDGKRQQIQLPPGSRILNQSETKPVPAPGTAPNRYDAKPKEGAELPRTPGTPAEPTPADVRRIKVVEAAPVDTNKRVAELEKKLADMMRELEGLRKDLKSNPGAPPMRALPVAPPAADPNSPRGR